MHEGDEDLARLVRWYENTKKLDETFNLTVGESCRIRNDHVDKLPKSGQNNSFYYGDGRFKLLYTHTEQGTYRWLDSEGNQGFDYHPDGLAFYEKHWEKI